jgi:hypothetical protein
MRESKFPAIEKAVFKWFVQARSSNLPVSGPIFQAMAQTFANLLNEPNFVASDGWIAGFKARHGLTFKSVCGESSAVDQSVVDDWAKKSWQEILDKQEKKDIFNCDETGLFFGDYCQIKHSPTKGNLAMVVKSRKSDLLSWCVPIWMDLKKSLC